MAYCFMDHSGVQQQLFSRVATTPSGDVALARRALAAAPPAFRSRREEEAIYQEAADRLGIRLLRDDLERVAPAAMPQDWLHAARRGVMAVQMPDGRTNILVAPDIRELGHFVRSVSARGIQSNHITLTSRRRFEQFIRHRFEAAWMEQTISHLIQVEPSASAHDRRLMTKTVVLILGFAMLVMVGLALPSTAPLVTFVFSLLFTGWSLMRLATCATANDVRDWQRLGDAQLPVYSILVPLYREAEIIPDLVKALRRLDYPPEKLDIKLIVEADDEATSAALEGQNLSACFDVVKLPPVGPRTKPKALSAVLPFAKGKLIVVFDAEDRPHPLQLREAAGRFATGGLRLGCLQAPLVISNLQSGTIARLFALEYAGLFRTFLPALAQWRLPLPLGGTSNHFRRAALDSVGGWDPFNMTEDADIGIRLARNGWEVDVIGYPTYEQAVTTPFAWLKQRRRWFKGWLQTLAVLLRSPVTTFRQLGLRGSLGLSATLVASTAAALLHPMFLVAAVKDLMEADVPLQAILIAGVAFSGYVAHATISYCGLQPLEKARLAPHCLLIPFYWLVLSLAAWLAVFELARRPFHWDKTMHLPEKP